MNKRQIVIIVCGVAALFVAMSAWIYSSVYLLRSESMVTRSMSSALHLPAADVSGLTVSYTTYLAHVDAQRAFLHGPMTQDSGVQRDITDNERKEAYERAIRIAAVEGMAKEVKVELTPLDIDRAFDSLIDRAGTSTTPDEVHAFLQAQFGWDEASYKQYLLRPAYLEEILRSKQGDGFDQALQARIDGAKRYLRF